MGLENFFKDALSRHTDYISYYVNRKLAEMNPGRAVLYSDTDVFDLESYARAGKCSLTTDTSVFNLFKSEWRGKGKRIKREAESAWFNVLWNGQLLDVVFLTWTDEGYKSRHFWIVGETSAIAENFMTEVCEWSSDVRGEILIYEGGYWKKSRALFETIKSANFDHLILPAKLKQEIQNDFQYFFSSKEIYEKFAIPWKRGVLLIGPPGNGKTQTVKALVNQLKTPCIYVKSFKSRYDDERDGMKYVFARARQNAPCLIVLEDIDSLFDKKNRSFFLNEMDGFAANSGIVVIATTNYPERLDPAILNRPSRFDRKYFFEPPAESERLAYIQVWSTSLDQEMRLSSGVESELAAATASFSFAYLKELFVSATVQWVSSSERTDMAAILKSRAADLREEMATRENSAEPEQEGTEQD